MYLSELESILHVHYHLFYLNTVLLNQTLILLEFLEDYNCVVAVKART